MKISKLQRTSIIENFCDSKSIHQKINGYFSKKVTRTRFCLRQGYIENIFLVVRFTVKKEAIFSDQSRRAFQKTFQESNCLPEELSFKPQSETAKWMTYKSLTNQTPLPRRTILKHNTSKRCIFVLSHEKFHADKWMSAIVRNVQAELSIRVK